MNHADYDDVLGTRVIIVLTLLHTVTSNFRVIFPKIKSRKIVNFIRVKTDCGKWVFSLFVLYTRIIIKQNVSFFNRSSDATKILENGFEIVVNFTFEFLKFFFILLKGLRKPIISNFLFIILNLLRRNF